MKTEVHKPVSSAGQDAVSRSKVRNDVQEKGGRTAEDVRSGAGEAERVERRGTLSVGGAQDVYARTDLAARPSAERVIETSEEATQLLVEVTAQVRDDAEQALQAQGTNVSRHLVELMGGK